MVRRKPAPSRASSSPSKNRRSQSGKETSGLSPSSRRRIDSPSTSKAHSPSRSKVHSPSASKTQDVSTRRRKRATKNVRVGTKIFKVNMTTLRSIHLLQKSVEHCIPKLPFARLIKEIIQQEAGSRDLRIQMHALEALQEAAEMYITKIFEDGNLAAHHARRITVMPVDIKFIMRLRG